MELRHRRRAFVNGAYNLRHSASIANSCFASDFVDNIQRASAPTFGWIRGSLSIWYIVPAMATFLCKAKRQVDYADIRNLPCIMPFGEGFLPTLTLNHSLRRLYLGRLSYSELPRHGLHSKMFRLCRQMITSRCRCIFALTVGVHCQICPAGYECQDFAGRFARNFTCKHARRHIVFTSRS